jgi:Zn-dependent peptidase ImmA (M78 family)
MRHAVSRANAILNEFKLSNLRGVELEDLYALKNIIYEEKYLHGSQARIISTNNYSKITVNTSLTYKNQKRFAQAHELGHFELHRGNRIICDNEKSFVAYHQKGGQELEANEFASELLMPLKSFKQFVSNKPFDVDLIKQAAEYYETSITSTSIRYAEYGDEHIAVVFSTEGKINWVRINERFPLQFIRVGLKVPSTSAVSDYYKSKSISKTAVVVNPLAWFCEDFNIEHYAKAKLFEQVFPIESLNSAISFLWQK